MILSGHLLAPLYTSIWRYKAARGRLEPVVFFCGDALDWVVFEPIQRYLPPIPVVAKNGAVRRDLARMGVEARPWPAFPRAVIMARHALHRFPCRSIVKIGMRHGAYHFKRLVAPGRYNAFDLFLFTSPHELEEARRMGITCGVAAGLPKLDPMLEPGARARAVEEGRRLGLDFTRPTVLFSATWDRSGLSAIDRWWDRVGELTGAYNVLVTLHPWVSPRFRRGVARQPGVHLLDTPRLWPSMLLADVLVGDTSSLIAEYCVLDRPVVTFRVPVAGRLTPEIHQILGEVSFRVDTFDELRDALPRALAQPSLHASQRRHLVQVALGTVEPGQGRRAASLIADVLRQRGVVVWPSP